MFVFFVFFFSSRRRHTRFDCDWSSDVCSSDLISNVKGGLDQADWMTKRDIIRALVKRVEVEKGQVNVVFRVDSLPFESRPERGGLQHCWWGDHRSLRRPLFGAPTRHRLHHILRQVRSQHLRHPSIRHFLLHSRHQPLVRDRVEVALQVRVYYPVIPCFQQSIHSPKRLFASSLRSKAVTLFGEVPLKDRLQYVSQRGLRYPVPHRRDSQRPLLAAPGFLYPRSLYRSRPVLPACKLPGYPPQVLDQ